LHNFVLSSAELAPRNQIRGRRSVTKILKKLKKTKTQDNQRKNKVRFYHCPTVAVEPIDGRKKKGRRLVATQAKWGRYQRET